MLDSTGMGGFCGRAGPGMMMDEDRSSRRCGVAPLAPLAGAVGVGVVLDRAVDPWGTAAWGLLALGALGLVAAVGLARRRRGWDRAGLAASAAVGLAWLALGGAWHHERYSDLPGDDLARAVAAEGWGPGERRVAWVRGVVDEEAAFRPGEDGPRDEGATRTVVALTAIRDEGAAGGWRPASGRMQVMVGGDRSDLVPGDGVEAAGQLGPVEGPLNPGEFDHRPLLRGRGIRLRLAVDGPSGVWADPAAVDWPWTRRLGAVRAWSVRQLANGLDPATLPLAAALLLGRREAVDPEVNDAFARTGTTHLLAISGLHLQVLAGGLVLLARGAGAARRPTFVLVAATVLAYAILVGLAPSVVRSAAMTVGACLAGWRSRCATPGNLLAGAALATLAWNPADLFDVGCQLSFLAVAAVLWLVPAVLAWDAPVLSPLDELERQAETWWRARRRLGLAYLRAGVIGSAAVWLAAWPLVALRFHLVAPVAILLNIPLIPLTSLALLLAGLTLVAAAAWPPLAWPFARGCGWALGGTEAIVRWGTACPGGHEFVAGPDPAGVVLFYALLAMATIALAARWPAPRARPWWRATIAAGCGLAIAPLLPARPEVAGADACAVGHGLAVVVRSPSGRTALYDAGKMGDPRVGRRVIAPALWALGARRIDVLVLSHADSDHFDAVPDLLDRFAVGEVRIPPGFDAPKDPAAARLVATIRARGIPVRAIAAGDAVDLGDGVTLTARHPAPDDRAGSDNARSVVLEVACARRRLLLTGDLEGPGLARLLARPRPDPPVDALLAPHHGGRTSNPPALYDWARPGVVAVSQRAPAAGARDPLAFLEAPDARGRLLRTWRDGAIRFRWAPDGLAATGFLDPPPAAPPSRAVAGFALPGGVVWVAAAGVLGGAALALVVVATEWGAWALVAPGRRPERSSPAGDLPAIPGIKRRITATAADGVELVGDWFPGRSGDGRAIILLHGLAEDRRAFEVRVDRLVTAGWNVAAVDARGSGASGGARVSFGGREADDLRAWLDALATILAAESPAPPRFAAWGRSMGAATALRAASADPRIEALVLEAPFDDLRPAVAAVLRRLRVPGWVAGLVLWRAGRLAGVSLHRPRPVDLAPGVAAATLVVHGSRDALIPPDRARALAAAIGRDHGRAADFVLVPDAGHANVFAVGGDTLAEAVVTFLDGAIPPPIPPG